MKNHRLSTLAANVGIEAQAKLLDGGWFDLYDGKQPSSPEETPGADAHLLASLRLPSPAFGRAAGGLVALSGGIVDPDAARTGTATWYRLSRADHKTAVEDGSVGVTEANFNMNSVNIQQHAEVVVRRFVLGME